MASAAKVFGAWFKVVVGCYSLESNREYGCLLTGPSISPQKGTPHKFRTAAHNER